MVFRTEGAYDATSVRPALYARRVPNIDTPSPRLSAPGRVTEDAPPAPASPSSKFRYEPALDGLRALAVLAIIAYHFDYSWARGAYLGVDLFFILSGFLITTLLIMEWRRSDTVALRAFWARRARRLLPALLVLLVFVAVYTRLVIEPWNRAAVRGDGIASLFYVANWRFIVDKQGYFELFSAASPSAPHVVARDRRAVLSRVAARRVRRDAREPGFAARARGGVRGRHRGVDRGDGDHVRTG